MALLDILKYPDKRLKMVSKPVEEIDDELVTLAINMLETMYNAPGIGLAAPQIGVLKRMIVLDVDYPNSEEIRIVLPKTVEEILNHETCYVFINPEVTWVSEEVNECEEGCLSVPGFNEVVKRPSQIKVTTTLINGDQVEFEADDLLATCIQHEIDHLDGKVFLDRISSLKRNIIKKKIMNKIKEDNDPTKHL